MPDEEIHVPPGSIETTEDVIKKGRVIPSFKYPSPTKLKNITDAIIYFSAGLMGTVAATDLFTGRQPKIIGFILSIVILACGAIQKSFGVKPAEDK